MKKLSVVTDFIRQSIALRKENKRIAIAWKKQPEKMLTLAAADMIEEVIDSKAYGEPFGHFMCIALTDAKQRKDGRTQQIRARAKSFVIMSIYPELTLLSHLTNLKKIPSTVDLYSNEYIQEYGVPYYRELIRKIRHTANNL